ncbi:acyltransferase family protein [Actinomycetospora flava]|uniref:Acyltransferase n=1 Tax=Actinomycetospora flava TaxID=3129232 RepID=A0ABU8M7Q3_9PSEU
MRRFSWDLIRVACVLMVVLYHSTQVVPDNYPDLVDRRFVFPHQIGASLLLVVSAYFVCASLRRHGVARWWVGRLARLLPGFVAATLLAYVAADVLTPGGPEPTLRDLAANLLMLWNWDRTWGYLDGSYWTIPLQLLAFTAAALLWRRRWGSGVRLRVVLWVAALLPMAQLPLKAIAPPVYGVLVDGLGFHRMHLFVAGVAIFLCARWRLGVPHAAALLGTCTAAQFVHGGIDASGALIGDRIAVAGVGVGMAAMLLAASGPDWDWLVPSAVRPVVTWLAGISYGVFLVHQTLGMVLMRRLQMIGVGPTLQTVAMLLQAVLVGWLLTRLVERPAHRQLMAAFDRRTVRPVVLPAPVSAPVPVAAAAADRTG